MRLSGPDETSGRTPPRGRSSARAWRVWLHEQLRRLGLGAPARASDGPPVTTSRKLSRLTGHLALSHPESQLGSGWTLQVHPSLLDHLPAHLLADGLYHLQEGDHLRVFEAAPHGTDDAEPVWEGTVHLGSDHGSTDGPSSAPRTDGLQPVHVGVSQHQWIRWFLSGARAEVERATGPRP